MADNPFDSDKTIDVRFKITHHDEERIETAREVSGWIAFEQADLAWCVGKQISNLIEQLFPDTEPCVDCYNAILDSAAGFYESRGLLSDGTKPACDQPDNPNKNTE
jgi:hypothetical protein